MSFTFEARTLLELGKELISTDEVALYELLKNSIDAGSKRVEILLNVHLRHSDFREAIVRLVEEDESPVSVLDALINSLIDPESPPVQEMVEELRSVTADSGEFVNVLKDHYRVLNSIEIRDTGHGMSLEELNDVFLRIGTRSRRDANTGGARYLGDKGIGRLAAMRLGDWLQVTTSRAAERYWNLLEIDWGMFAHDARLDVSSVHIEPEIGDEKEDHNSSGTSILITDLQGDWDMVRFTDVLQGRIARMIDPFVAGLANKLLVARFNGSRVQIPSIPQRLLKSAHAVCKVDFQINEAGEPVLTGFVDYAQKHRRIEIDQRGADVFSLSQTPVKRRAKRGHAAERLVPVRRSTLEKLNRFSCEIYWWNRRILSSVEGLTSTGAETRGEISNWSGGPMLYRYGFRILPYGDPGNDWLNLDEVAFSSKGFKLNRQQVIGRVLIDTPHTVISEQTNREGLIETEVVSALRRIMMWVLHTEMRGLINEADQIEQIERRAAEQENSAISNTRERVERALEKVRNEIGDEAGAEIDELAKSVARLSEQSQSLISRIEAVIKEAEKEREKFLYLAGIGLMTEFIFHELDRAVGHAMESIGRGAVKAETLDSLKEQLKTLQKRVAAFDELTGEKRQSKSSFDLVDLVKTVLENHRNEFERHGIKCTIDGSEHAFPVKAVKGMVIQILENLLTNAAYWLKQQKRFEADFTPEIAVAIDPGEKCMTIEDNGPGVPEDRIERIFQPFITSKPTGQGRGLGLYIARELAEYHGWRLHMDDEIGRVREGRSNMFVLDMGAE